jgi:hypothetical protein
MYSGPGPAIIDGSGSIFAHSQTRRVLAIEWPIPAGNDLQLVTLVNSSHNTLEGQGPTSTPGFARQTNSRIAPGLLVLERHPYLEPILKRELAGPGLLVRPCRSPQDLLSLAQRMPASICVLDWCGWSAEILTLLDRLQVAQCGAKPILVGPAELAPLEWAAREEGVVGFFAPLIEPPLLIALCQRLLEGVDRFPNNPVS